MDFELDTLTAHSGRAMVQAEAAERSLRNGGASDAESSGLQCQASKPEGGAWETVPTPGLGPAAGSSHASDGPAELRRSSVVVVVLDPHHTTRGAAGRAAAALVHQGLLTLMALGLALIMSPLAAAIEPCVELFTCQLPNFVPSLPCQGLLTEGRGVHLVVCAVLPAFLMLNGILLAAIEANPRARRLLLHTMLVGLAAGVAFPLYYASAAAPSLSALQVVLYVSVAGIPVFLAPQVSFAFWGLATANRRSWKRAALEIAFGVTVGATSTILALSVGLYVALSDQIPDGLTGVVINGKSCRKRRTRPASS